jgi:hypothetical protein
MHPMHRSVAIGSFVLVYGLDFVHVVANVRFNGQWSTFVTHCNLGQWHMEYVAGVRNAPTCLRCMVAT